MRLGLNLGYWGAGRDASDLVLARAAEKLGYSVVWAAESYGSDAPTVLSWVAATTERIGIGSAVMQIPARTPAMTAMTAATLDALSGGRFHLGLGVSGPQVSEGWHGVRFAHPLARTREYVDVVRMALAGERVRYQGEHVRLPLPDGPGKALRLLAPGVRDAGDRIPIYLAAVGPANLELTGRIADGWLGVFFSPEHAEVSIDPIRRGREATGRSMAGFDVVPTVPVSIHDDLDAAADPLRAYAALYVGGMGSREQNFYTGLAARMGFEAQALRVQDLYLERQYEAAAAAVPRDFVDATSLIGPVDRIADRMRAFAEAGVTTLTVAPEAATPEERITTLRRTAEALEAAGLAP
jgi:F420-dependent oxidoreductase-like protein